MDRSLDRSLDEILAERKPVRSRSYIMKERSVSNKFYSQTGGRGSRAPRGNGNGNGGRRRETGRQEYPRDGVRKVRIH